MTRTRARYLLTGAVIAIGFLVLWDVELSSQVVVHHEHQVSLGEPETCLSCHDGVIAPQVGVCTADCEVFGVAFSHPVYRQYPPLRKRSEFRPRDQVEAAGILLTNDEITCVSCHDLTNQEKHHLVIDNSSSRLCLTCHIR